MPTNTTRLALPKADGADNARDYLKGAISGGGLWTALGTLDQALLQTLADAKGDLLTASAADTMARKAVGANGTLLMADSAQSDGLKWEGAWTTFTPTLSQNGVRTLTVTFARYMIIGKTVHLELSVVCTDAGTAGNNIIIGAIPAAIAPARFGTSANVIGVGVFNDVSVNIYAGLAVAITAATIKLLSCDSAGIGDYMGSQGPNVALANNDVISVSCTYEIA